MINFKKYVLAAALVVPSVFTLEAKNADAAKIAIDKSLASGVNVRGEATMGDNIVGLISEDNKLYEIKSEEGEWLKIDFDGKDAFVAKRFFHILDKDKIIVDTNFRKGPSLEDEVIKVLPAGEVVEVLEIGENGYVKVRLDDEEKSEGYVYHNLLETFREANEKKQAQQAPKQQAQAPAQTQQVQAPVQQQVVSQPVQQTYQASTNWAKEWIAQRESNGSYTAYNPNGGYYGRYQLNPSLIHYGASPAEQEAAADAYVAQRYGSWEAAQAFWAANGWY